MTVVAQRVKKVLDENLLCYDTIPHVTDFTALESAEHTHVSGKAFAKAVIVWVDQEFVMAVVPAHQRVNLQTLQQHLGAKHIKLARESRLKRHFPDCDLGAIPPFGSLYDMPVFVSRQLLSNESVAFNAGSHEMVITMSMQDYLQITRPQVLAHLSKPWK